MLHRSLLSFVALSLISFVSFLALSAPQESNPQANAANAATQGALHVVDAKGQPKNLVCPLKHTDVKAEISGFLARVTVTQDFENPFKEKIEAIYTFPLPAAAAVDDMTMRVGERATVRGRILRREQAQQVYQAARDAGQVASLLDQERPNIFTQSIANILPGERVTVTISYVEILKYEDGSYEFSFPMVVGPRYVPGAATGRQGGGRLPDTDRVPDASRITPQVAPAGTRAGHDISISVALDAGVPVEEIKSASHQIEIERPAQGSALVRLKDGATIPNKDFILRYDVAGKRIEDALITHRTADKGGFFTLILQPPDKIAEADITPREIVFVLDTSGSMSGFPVEKAKETMKLALDNLNPQDTFNLITFAGDTHILFPEPVAPTPENMQRAQAFLASRAGGGGTEMMKAIRAALAPTDSQAHLRVVCFMTDGHVGNDMEIISEVQKHPNARVFSFGIGSSVNRFLLDKMAEYGRGEVEYVSLQDDGSAAARKFYERVHNPLLTDILIDWSGLPVTDVYPQRIPDLFGAKPVILSGRYNAAARGKIQLRGKTRGRDFTREIAVEFPEAESRHDVLSTLWARARIDDLMGQDFNGMQRGNTRADLSETITQLGLEFRLLTQFTSFVAVEEMIVTDPTSGQPRRIEVPVELPEGVNRAGALGEADQVVVASGTRSFMFLSGKDRGVGGGGGGSRNVMRREKAQTRAAQPAPIPAATPAPSPVPLAADAVSVNADEMIKVETKPLSPEEQKQQQLRAKLHPLLAAVVERVQKKVAQPGAEESKFVRDGKAEVQVWLTDKSPETIAQLKQLGFEVILDPQSAKLLIGRITIEKLSALAELKAVRYVAPQMANK